jgi:hypothetical protein
VADDPQALQPRGDAPLQPRDPLRWTLQVAATPEQVLDKLRGLAIDRVTVAAIADNTCRLVRLGGDATHHATLLVQPRTDGAEVVLTADKIKIHRGGVSLALALVCLWTASAMAARYPGSAAAYFVLGSLALLAIAHMWWSERRRRRQEFAGIARVVDYVLIPLKPGEAGAAYRVRASVPDPTPAPKDRRRGRTRARR